MKNYLTLLFFTFFSLPLFAQIYVDGKPLAEIYEGKYLQVECASFGNRVRIDFGFSKNDFSQFKIINDEKGEPLRFNNSVQLLNYFDKNGWELASTYENEGSFFFKRKSDS